MLIVFLFLYVPPLSRALTCTVTVCVLVPISSFVGCKVHEIESTGLPIFVVVADKKRGAFILPTLEILSHATFTFTQRLIILPQTSGAWGRGSAHFSPPLKTRT